MSEAHEALDSLLRAVNRELHALIQDVLEQHELPMPAMSVLGQVLKTPGLTISELSRKACMAKSHISLTVQSLVRKGFLEKRADPADQRLARIYPTGMAESKYQETKAAIQLRVARALSAIPDDKVHLLTQGLGALLAALKQH